MLKLRLLPWRISAVTAALLFLLVIIFPLCYDIVTLCFFKNSIICCKTYFYYEVST